MSARTRQRSNPARLSPLSALFPPSVAVAELQWQVTAEAFTLEPSALALLSKREWESIRTCAESRVRDFYAGRLCAHLALAQLGVTDFDLLAGPDRQPLWPAGFTGSITHTEGFSAAVVARCCRVVGLGIDVERISAVHPDLWPTISSPGELERLRSLPAGVQLIAAALIFVAKEAFFKCQYPLAGERFDFGEVQVDGADWESDSGDFQLNWRTPSKLDGLVPASAHGRLSGRFQRREQFLIAGVTLAAP